MSMPVPPKPPSKRRRANVPASYGLAVPTIAPAAPPVDRDLGFDASPMVKRMWDALAGSVESRFFSAADWERARLELFFANQVLAGPINGAAWSTVQAGLNSLLISPAEKRRAGIELRPSVDPDADAAVLVMARYQDKLKSE